MKNGSYFVVFPLLTFTLFGCTTGGVSKNISKNYDIEEEPHKSIVIGKVEIKQKGVIGIITHRDIVIKKAGSDTNIPSPKIGDYFFISLDEGEYVIESSSIGFGTLGALGYRYPAQLNVRFRVRPGEVVYIGDLTVTYKLVVIGMNVGVTGRDILVSDQYETAINEFRKKYPTIKADVQKSLIERDVPVMQKQMYDTALLRVDPVQEAVGGSIVVIIPTDERLWERWVARGSKPAQRDNLVQYSKNELLAMVEALRKRALFDSVTLQQSDNPEQVSFEEDFALINPVSQIREWLVKMREPMAQRTVNVQARDATMSFSQWLNRWLDSIKDAAKDLKGAAKE